METKTVKRDVYAIITDRIIERLKQGVIPWKQPWTNAGMPQNLITKRSYRGINVMLLASMGYEKKFFLSNKQAKELGASVRKGEIPCPVVLWKWPEQKQVDGVDKSEETKKYPILKYYSVFNISQCEGVPKEIIPSIVRGAYPILACEKVFNEMPIKPKLQSKENRAYYNPLKDFINMPAKKNFESDEGYYATLFHEAIHSTGHRSRLDRRGLLDMAEHGASKYSFEELVAEIGACFLESHAGIVE